MLAETPSEPLLDPHTPESFQEPEAARPLTSVPWTPAEGIGLVALAVALTLAAGVFAAWVFSHDWGASAESLAVGGALFLTYGAQVGLVALAARKRGDGVRLSVGLRSFVPVGLWIGAALGLAAGMRVFSSLYEAVLRRMGIALSGQNVDVTRLLPAGGVGTAMTILLLVVVAPFAEEVVFRGVLFSAFRESWGMWPAIFGSAAVFSAVHVNLYSFVPLFLLGVGLGWLFAESRSLWVSVTAHATFNLLGVVTLYVLQAMRLS